MHTHYADIRSRISEEPSWFDEFAVPRYGPFAPTSLAFCYAREAALVLAACQACTHHFHLALSHRDQTIGAPDIATAILKRDLHYGDPPQIGCCDVGHATTVIELRVLEYWRRDYAAKHWRREPSFEVGVVSELMADRRAFAPYVDWAGNPPLPVSFGTITEEAGGAQFMEVVEELCPRYPALQRHIIEDAVRSHWQTGTFVGRCFSDAERDLPEDFQTV